MIKFFRRIRQNLLSENKFSKYLIYAIGEIILVVIGILIALQINTWNEEKKSNKKELYFLNGIKNDLVIDTTALSALKRGCQLRLSSYKLIDPEFEINEFQQTEIDTSFNFRRLFNRVGSFRPTIGIYDAMISDGQSQIIKNRTLFNRIQSIYQDGVPKLESLYDDLKQNEVNIKFKWAETIRYVPFKSYNEISDRALVSDLYITHGKIRWYCERCQVHKEQIRQVILELDKEIEANRE